MQKYCFHCQICKFVGFLLLSSLWLRKLPNTATTTTTPTLYFNVLDEDWVARSTIITVCDSRRLPNDHIPSGFQGNLSGTKKIIWENVMKCKSKEFVLISCCKNHISQLFKGWIYAVCHAIREKGTFLISISEDCFMFAIFVIFCDWSIVYLIAWLFHIRLLARHTKLDIRHKVCIR